MDSSHKKIAIATDAPFYLDARARRTAEVLAGIDASVMIYAQGFFVEQSQAATPEGMNLVTSTVPNGGMRKLGWHVANRLLPLAAYKKRNRELVKTLIGFQPDIIHSVNVFNLEACVEVAKRTGCKLIYESYEYWPEHLFADQYGLAKSYASHLASVEREVTPYIDQFITVSEPFAQWYQSEVGMPTAQVVLNANVPRTPITKPVSSSKLRCVHSGNVTAIRNVDCAVKALSFVENVELTVLGSGVDLPSVQSLVKADALSARVRFEKMVPHNQTIQKLAEFDVGLQLMMPTSMECDGTIPNKLFDYFAAGLASVVVSTQGVRTLGGIEDAALLIEDAKPETIADALRKLHDDRELLGHLQEQALLMSERYSREKQMDQIIMLYKELGVVFS